MPASERGADRGTDALQAELDRLQGPVLVLSTLVGRGMYSLGEALVERLAGRPDVFHRAVEDFLPGRALSEDVHRYRFLSSRMPWLLFVAYRFPPIYLRKLLRERYLRRTDLGRLEAELEARSVRTVVCVSHRPAFWAAGLKEERGLDVRLTGLLGEYGASLGWRYIPWERMDAFWSPVAAEETGLRLPPHVTFARVALPARRAFEALRATPGDPRAVLVVCGSWGQGRIGRVVRELLSLPTPLRIHAVCGANDRLRAEVSRELAGEAAVTVHGEVESLAPLMETCGSVVTKPGIATLVEAHAAGRKLFLLRGMPVAEDNNARYAVRSLGAEPFRREAIASWLANA